MITTAIVIPSCHGYSDIWPVLFESMDRFIVGGSPPVFIISDSNQPVPDHINHISLSHDISWSDNLIIGLGSIDAEYILLWIDDLVLINTLDWSQVQSHINWLHQQHGHYLRLNPTPPGSKYFNSRYTQIMPGDLYRSSTVFSIWKKSVLLDCLKSGENAWEFEIRGAERTDIYQHWYAMSEYSIGYVNLVVKGLVDPRALKKLHAVDLNFDSKRIAFSVGQLVHQYVRDVRFNIFRAFPRSTRRFVKKLFTPNNK